LLVFGPNSLSKDVLNFSILRPLELILCNGDTRVGKRELATGGGKAGAVRIGDEPPGMSGVPRSLPSSVPKCEGPRAPS